MASTVSSSIPITASRFALLQVESDTDSVSGEEGGSQGVNKCWASGVRSTMNEKKKKRRKKKEQQQSEVNEIPQKSSRGRCLSQHEQNLHTAVQKDSQEENWQKWRQRDEQLASEMFEADLEKALLLSTLEYEEHKKVHENVEKTSAQTKAMSKKEKKKQQGKDKPLAVTLKSFQLDNNLDHIVKNHEELGLRDGKTERLKLELEKKDAEIEQLKNIIAQREAKYKVVKARNAKLLKMMQEGEMKHKAEILLQADESQILKNELTLEVTRLHAALEQERSKVKLLQAELSKYQEGKKAEKPGRT